MCGLGLGQHPEVGSESGSGIGPWWGCKAGSATLIWGDGVFTTSWVHADSPREDLVGGAHSVRHPVDAGRRRGAPDVLTLCCRPHDEERRAVPRPRCRHGDADAAAVTCAATLAGTGFVWLRAIPCPRCFPRRSLSFCTLQQLAWSCRTCRLTVVGSTITHRPKCVQLGFEF